MTKRVIINEPISFTEKSFPYDYQEYLRWINGDKGLIESLLQISGHLGQKGTTYYNQSIKGKGSQHYPEVKYASHLVKDKGIQPENIFYEKYCLSIEFIKKQLGKKGWDAQQLLVAHYRISEVFSEDFFTVFDKLCELNQDIIERKTNKNRIYVDLCAINNKEYQIHFCEIKRYNSTDTFKKDQLLFLGFVCHAIEILKERAFRNKMYTVNADLIVFVPEDDMIRYRPQRHIVPSFKVYLI